MFAVAVFEFTVWGVLYVMKAETNKPWWKGFGRGVAYMIYVALNYPVVWRAFIQLVFGKQGWAKTKRNAEVTQSSSAVTARFD